MSLLSIALLWTGTRRLAASLGLEGPLEAACLLVVFSCQMLYAGTCRVGNDALVAPWLVWFLFAVIESFRRPGSKQHGAGRDPHGGRLTHQVFLTGVPPARLRRAGGAVPARHAKNRRRDPLRGNHRRTRRTVVPPQPRPVPQSHRDRRDVWYGTERDLPRRSRLALGEEHRRDGPRRVVDRQQFVHHLFPCDARCGAGPAGRSPWCFTPCASGDLRGRDHHRGRRTLWGVVAPDHAGVLSFERGPGHRRDALVRASERCLRSWRWHSPACVRWGSRENGSPP